MPIRKTHEQYVLELSKLHPYIEVREEYINAKTPILHRCLRENCGHEWSGIPDCVLNSKNGCPKCSKKIRRTHEEYVVKLKEKRPELIVLEEYQGSKVDILHRCSVCNSILPMKPYNALTAKSCMVCAKQIIGPPPEYKNSIWASQYKEIALLYMTEEQAKSHMSFSSKKISLTCPDCGKIRFISPGHLFTEGFSCICKDGISFPNKFMYNLIDQLKLEFEPEYSPDWAGNRRYDIFIPEFNMIIENHGMQHFCESSGNFRKSVTLEEQIRIDNEKKEMALKNGVMYYVELDCRLSNMDYIKQSVMDSILPNILHFTDDDINWQQCSINGLKNVIKECANLWNQGLGAGQIAPILKVDPTLISQYLHKAAEVGWCEYSKELAMKRKGEQSRGIKHCNATPVYCIEMDKIFATVNDAKIEIDPVHRKAHIAATCDGTYQKTKGYSFRYIEDKQKKDGTIVLGAITLGLITRERYEEFVSSLST